jgi:hypothetical protein
MSIGNAISFRTDGRYILQVSTANASDLPGPKTLLTLKEITLSSDSAGLPTSAAPVTVQNLYGILRPTSTREKEEWSKIGVTASYAYYVSPSQFSSDINRSKLVEKNLLVSATKTFEIVGIEDNTEVSHGAHYKTMLEVLE